MLTTATRTKGEAALAAALRKVARGPIERCAVEIGAVPTATGHMTSKATAVTVRVTDDWWRTVGLPGHALDDDHRFVLAARPKLVLDWRQRGDGRWSPVVAAG
jgi:hypothetical protein